MDSNQAFALVATLALVVVARIGYRYARKGWNQAAVTTANVLVTFSLCFTIVGLALLLHELSSVASGNSDGAIQLLTKKLRELPWLFFPTALGLFLSIGFQMMQARSDQLVEQTSSPEGHLQASAAELSQAAGSLTKVVGDLGNASTSLSSAQGELREGLQGSVAQLQTISSKLVDFEPARWSEKLDAASGRLEQVSENLSGLSASFKEDLLKVTQGSSETVTALQQIAGQSLTSLKALEEATSDLLRSSDSVKGSLSQMLGAIDRLRESEEKFGDLSSGVSALEASLNQLRDSLGQNDSRQHEILEQLERMIASLSTSLNEAMAPALKEWKDASQLFRDNLSAVRQALDTSTERFSTTTDRLEAINQSIDRVLGESRAQSQAISDRLGHSLQTHLDALITQTKSFFEVPPKLFERLADSLEEGRSSNGNLQAKLSEVAASTSKMDASIVDLTSGLGGFTKQLSEDAAARVQEATADRETQARLVACLERLEQTWSGSSAGRRTWPTWLWLSVGMATVVAITALLAPTVGRWVRSPAPVKAPAPQHSVSQPAVPAVPRPSKTPSKSEKSATESLTPWAPGRQR